jgi:hypothetical protein
MSQEIRANYDQIDLLPQCLEDGRVAQASSSDVCDARAE